MKNNKKIIILFIVFLIIGIALGIVIDAKILNKNDSKNESNYGEKIKQSSYSSEDLNKKIDKIDSLYQKLNELKLQEVDVESEIGILQNEVNNATNFEFEDDIYQIDQENVEDENNEIEDNTDEQSNIENETVENGAIENETGENETVENESSETESVENEEITEPTEGQVEDEGEM